jgi:hypothetical protein
MTSLGFENYGEALKIYLARYREVNNFRDSESDCRPSSTSTDNFRTLSLVVSISVQARLARREKQVPPTTALTAPPCSETLWTHLRKAQPTSLATRSHTSPSIKGAIDDLSPDLCHLCFPFDVFMLLSNYPWSENI